MSRLVLVGELNPYGANPHTALYHLPRNASGNRLRQHLGLKDATYAGLQKQNLCDLRWSAPAAQGRATLLLKMRFDVVVCLGAKVSRAMTDALDWWPLDFFKAARDGEKGDVTLVCLPHPSGLNRLWNEPGARDKARELLRRACPNVPWGEAV